MDQKLPKGTLTYKCETLSLDDIVKTRILSIEGELDDISGAGQTHACINLTHNLDSKNKLAVTAPNVGHYGLFSGRRWREENYPKIANFCLFNKYE